MSPPSLTLSLNDREHIEVIVHADGPVRRRRGEEEQEMSRSRMMTILRASIPTPMDLAEGAVPRVAEAEAATAIAHPSSKIPRMIPRHGRVSRRYT